MQKLKQLMKTTFVLLAMLIPGAPLIMKRIAIRKVREHLGEQEPEVPLLQVNQDIPRKIIYFYAPFCGQSKAMMPIIDRLQQEFPGLIKVDATQNPELTQLFSVTATPTFIITEASRVSEVKIGISSEAWIRQKLSGECRSKEFFNTIK